VKRIDLAFLENGDEQNASPGQCVRLFVTGHFRKAGEIAHLNLIHAASASFIDSKIHTSFH
jgi:hypothetical protein